METLAEKIEQEALEELYFFNSLDNGALEPWATSQGVNAYCFRGSKESFAKLSFSKDSKFRLSKIDSEYHNYVVEYNYGFTTEVKMPGILFFIDPFEKVADAYCGD